MKETQDRRTFLSRLSALGLGMAGLPAVGCWLRPRWDDYPFKLGVASGDPGSDGFVLWTRLLPDDSASLASRNVDVRWEIATDDGMRNVIRRGTAVAEAQFAHSVHAEVNGLEPDRWYWYRFDAGAEASPIGRTRTFPTAGTTKDRLQFVFASCQHYEQGFYAAHRHILEEPIDFVAFLGDYVYESNVAQGVRSHGAEEPATLEEYRARYALYKRDEDLQASHAAFPWVVTFDDHEFDNNYAGLNPQDDQSAEEFRLKRAAAYRAYYEHMPLRKSTLPVGPDMSLFRSLSFGSLARFHVLDTRQYRSDQSCGDGRRPICEEWSQSDRTVLGDAQSSWLQEGLASGGATWSVLAQQIMMVPFEVDPSPTESYNMDSWSGYPVARQRLLEFIASRKVPNVVAITGDVHANYASELPLNFRESSSPSVAVEYVGTSISSGGNGRDAIPAVEAALGGNPWMKYHSARRGYVRCDVTPSEFRANVKLLRSVASRDEPVIATHSFVTPAGDSRVERA